MQAREISQCEKKITILPDDFLSLNGPEPTEKILCYFKCVYEENGSLNSDGIITIDKMIENINSRRPLTEDSKTAIKECLKDVKPIKTCGDLKPTYQCLDKILEKKVC